MAIPIVLFYFTRLRGKLPFRPVFALFGLFITACGWTHFLGYYTFYTPIYRMDGLLKLVTAFVSWLTVFALVPVVPQVLAMRSPQELEKEIIARKRAEEALQQAYDGLEVRVQERTAQIQQLNEDLQHAMAETHHRVKNNLQVVSALLEMQIDETPDAIPRVVVQESLQQIKTIAVVHDLLSRDHTPGEVDIGQVLRNLLPLLAVGLQKESGAITIRLEGHPDPIYLPTKAATGLALVVNELISNAVKHGSPSQRSTDTNDRVILKLSRQPQEQILLQVEDDGPGFPEGFDVSTDAHLGLALVASIVANDLQGEVTYANRTMEGQSASRGARVSLHFPEHPTVE